MIIKYRLGQVVEIFPPIGYQAALAEMCAADGLLVLQSDDCSDQIPAKVYEYLRAGRPILALTDPEGDTAGALRLAGLHGIARLDSEREIAQVLPVLVRDWRKGKAVMPQAHAVQNASRRGRSEALAQLLNTTLAV